MSDRTPDRPIVCPGCDKPRPTTIEGCLDPANACCNPDCHGMWGTGCYHCHHPSYFAENIHRRWRRARPASDQYAGNMGRALRLLYALALEIDERVATRSGEQVCRACGGRGDVIVDIERGIYMNGGRRSLRTSTTPCTCDGPTRPVTVSLHQVVEAMSTRPPRGSFTYRPVSDIPERWLVDLDAMEAAGWRDIVLPSTKADHAARCKWWNENGNRLSTPAERDDNGSCPQPHHPGRHGPSVTPAWQCRWWRAWSAWARGGETPDADALARDLRRLLPALEAREAAKAEARRARRPFDGLSLRECGRVVATLIGSSMVEIQSGEIPGRKIGSRWKASWQAEVRDGGVVANIAIDPAAMPPERMELSAGYETPATVPGLLASIADVDPAEPQRAGPPIGGRLSRRLRKRRE